MKKIMSLKFIVSVLAIIAFGLALKSCKKVDNNSGLSTKETEAAKSSILKAIQDKYGPVSSAEVYPVNKDPEILSYRNTSGTMISFKAGGVSPNGTLGGACFYNCSNTSNPANLHLVYTLQSIQRSYYCQPNATGSLNDIVVSWQISVPFTPLLADPTNPANLSVGSVVVTPPIGPVKGDNSIPITISNLGVDPACIANNLYKISYTYQSVTNDIAFNNGYAIDTYLKLYNNCGLVGNLITTSTVSTNLAGKTAPCDRTDHIWINPGGGPSGCATGAGSNPTTCSVATGMVQIDNTQLEYRKVNAASGNLGWEEQTSAINYAYSLSAGQPYATITPTGFFYLTSMLPGSGTWLVRYRNLKGTTCSFIGTSYTTPPSTSLAWPGNWVVEVWPL